MTELEKRIWTESIGRVLKENTPWDSKNQSERYHVALNSIKMPPKVVLARAISIITKEHPEIKIKSIGGGIPTNQFIEELGFKITEDLIYNTTDYEKLRSQIEKRIKNQKIFQDFINFGSSVLNNLDIEVYKVRMAIESQGILSIIVGMRPVYSYEEEGRSATIGLLVSKNFKNKNQEKYDFISAYDFKGEPSQQLIKVKVNDWSEMSQALLDEFKAQFELQYNQIKNSKLTQWNVEANTTNNALKYVFFKSENVERFMTTKITKESDKPYFDLGMLSAYAKIVDKSYKANSKEAEWFYDTRDKLYHLVHLLGKRLNENFVVVYKEKPNGQRGPGLIGFKNYILAGFAPEDDVVADDLFMKVSFSSLKENPVFDINIDLNFRKGTSPFLMERDTIFASHYKEWPINEDFPQSWESLLDAIEIEIKNLTKVYKSYLARPKMNNNSSNDLRIPNQIFYGPPGTGKTYQTISQAISIVDFEFYDKNKSNRNSLVERFKELTITNWSDTKGQIAFCTFHQSFTYEDFVEGIKPKVVNDKDIIYEVQKGIFKSICDRARTATNGSSDFDSTINSLQNDILEEGPITLATNRGNKFDVNYTGQTTFRIKPHESSAENPQYPASIENIRALYEGAPLTDLYNPSYVKGILEYLYKRYDLPKYQEVKNNGKPYVIIIDEINRGNVASIFGELITLIEPNKRSGAIEELSVILPYSKKEFTVPNNVHIIGTMNTADRSVEALDTALRRRFSFRETMPDYSVVEKELGAKNFWNDSSVSEILKKINKRITHLIDRDHQIGHSYFLNLKDVPANEFSTTMAAIFSENIIPLLQEYFFNDFSRIGMVIGEGFLNNIKWGANDFAKFDEGNSEDYEDNLFEIIDPKSMKTDQFEEAIKSLLN